MGERATWGTGQTSEHKEPEESLREQDGQLEGVSSKGTAPTRGVGTLPCALGWCQGQ